MSVAKHSIFKCCHSSSRGYYGPSSTKLNTLNVAAEMGFVARNFGPPLPPKANDEPNEGSDTEVLPVPRYPSMPLYDPAFLEFFSKRVNIPVEEDPFSIDLFEKQVELEARVDRAIKRGVKYAKEWVPTESSIKLTLCLSHVRRPFYPCKNFFQFTAEFLRVKDVSVSKLIEAVEFTFYNETLPSTIWFPSINPENTGCLVKRISKKTTVRVAVFIKSTIYTTRPEFGYLIGIKKGTLCDIKHAFYVYALHNNLISFEKRVVNCDSYLKKIFNKNELTPNSLWRDFHTQVVTDVPPIEFTYYVDDKRFNKLVFEIKTISTAITRAHRDIVINDYKKMEDKISALNNEITKLKKELKESMDEKKVYESIAENPYEFFNEWHETTVETAFTNVETRTNPDNYDPSLFADEDVMKSAVKRCLVSRLKPKQKTEVTDPQVTTQVMDKKA